MRKILIFVWVLFLGSRFLGAGDMASFVNLGFSENSQYFMFGQYGVLQDGGKPYVDIFLVDVVTNRFVDNGTVSRIFDLHVQPGNDGRGALFNILEDSIGLKERHGIDHLITGRILYLLVDGDVPKGVLDFRDFQTKKRYVISLIQTAWGSGKSVTSSFHLNVKVEENSGESYFYTVGLPNYRRDGVKSYRIKQVIMGNDNRSHIFLIEKEIIDSEGSNLRYMIETLKIH